MALPRVTLPNGNPGVALPRPLDSADAGRVRRAFALQRRGNIPAALQATAELEDKLLLGHILADRYLGPVHRSTAEELTDWLKNYGAEPDSQSIYALLLRRLPRGAAVPMRPSAAILPSVRVPEATIVDLELADQRVLPETIAARAALLRAGTARTLFTRNRDRDALNVALAAFRQTPPEQRVGEAGFLAGLAAWRLGRLEQAQLLFEEAVTAPVTPPSIRAAAAFWAARTHLRQDSADFWTWLNRAAAEPRTFYGLIAGRGIAGDNGRGSELAGQADVEAIAGTPEGWRAFALLQVGQPDRAEAELRLLWSTVQEDRPMHRSLLLVAASLGLTDLSAQLATLIETDEGLPPGTLHLPLPRLRPQGGFRVDPALVYGLTRLESNFDAYAVSAAGARGLMQLMPTTARYISGNDFLDDASLHVPSVNLDLGQRYVAFLARQGAIDGDLIRVLASYNSGPGNFMRWSADLRDDGDPLLFIEAIPTDETRAFVQRALAYTWLYASRLHLPSPSLDELAAGEFPRFTPLASQGKLASAALH